MDEIVAECGAGEATFWLISADGMRMEGTLNCGKTPEVIENITVPADDSVVGMVAQSGVPITIGPDARYNPIVDLAAGTRTNAMIVAPVQVAMERCGVLSAIKTPELGLFTADAAERLQWKAYLLGLILTDSLRSASGITNEYPPTT